MANGFEHRPVLLEESLSLLGLEPGAVVVDGTLGGGGHAAAILERSAPDGLLIGLDVDDAALRAAADELAGFGERLLAVRSSFRDLREVLNERGIDSVDAVLLDLGVSSPQIDRPERGFRFAREHASEYGLDLPVLLDLEHRLVEATGVTVTPEVAVLTAGGALPRDGIGLAVGVLPLAVGCWVLWKRPDPAGESV